MEEFNYLSCIVSIILGLGLTHLISNFTSIIKSSKEEKEKYDINYFLWLLAFFILYIIYWWAYWDYHKITHWSFNEFILLIVGPIGLHIATDILTFEKGDESVNSTLHFTNNKKLFFSILIALQIWGIFLRPIIRNEFTLEGFFNTYKFCQYFLLCLFSCGLFIKSKTLQTVVVTLFLCEMGFVVALRYILE